MKYLKLYEDYSNEAGPITLEEFLKQQKPEFKALNSRPNEIHCHNSNINSLKGIEKFLNLKLLSCYGNKLKNLEGIENCPNLMDLYCYKNELTSLKGLENCINLEIFDCSDNQLTNLNEIEDFDLDILVCYNNPFEFPLSVDLIINKKDLSDYYTTKQVLNFSSYEFQKKFLTEHPDKVADLQPFGFAYMIKKEFPALIRGNEWGFFDEKGNQK